MIILIISSIIIIITINIIIITIIVINIIIWTPTGHRGHPFARAGHHGTPRDTGGTPRATADPVENHLVRPRLSDSRRSLARPRSFASPARTARTNTKPKSISR